MKLTKRQYNILKFLINNRNDFISSYNIGVVFGVSNRTIKSEIYAIKEYTKAFGSFRIITAPSKGIKIHIISNEDFVFEMAGFSKSDATIPDNDMNERIFQLLRYLITSNTFRSKDAILATLYISESTFYKIYQKAKVILDDFNLKIQFSKIRGYHITGSEIDKRNLIAKHKLMDAHPDAVGFGQRISEVYSFVVETFIKFEYKVTDQVLQNISSHIVLMENRVSNGNIIDFIANNNLNDYVEYEISRVICNKYLKEYRLNEVCFENEIYLLAQTILGKINYSINEELQHDINRFITFCYKKIYEKFNINFELVEKLKLLLVLHMVPLMYRINSRTQLTNLMATEIQQQFPLANDISLYFSLLFNEEFNLDLSKDEISYLALYFNYGIEELDISSVSKRLLIITSLRTSETVLLRHKLLTWFPKQIVDIQFMNPDHDIPDLEQFDAIFTTEEIKESYQNSVMHINVFPDEHDYKKINLALNGYINTDSIIEKFSPECFYYGTAASKNEAITIVCGNAIRKFNLEEPFLQTITSREKIASTYFGNGVAIPHPLAPITEETFVSVAILDKPIVWDSHNDVQFIILISIEKNNPKAFQFWYHMADLIRNSELVRKAIESRTFDNFIAVIRNSLDKSS